MKITAIKLSRRHGGGHQHAVVYAKIGGKFIEIIREDANGIYDATVSIGDINKIAAFELSTDDLIASGGIVEP